MGSKLDKIRGMFAEMADAPPDPLSPAELFYNMLLKHPIVTKYISEDAFCIEIYQSLTNSNVLIDLEKLPMSEEERIDVFEQLLEFGNDQLDVSMSFRSAGGFVAELRNDLIGTSEDYMDWYCSGPECYLSPRIAEIYDEYNIKWSAWNDK